MHLLLNNRYLGEKVTTRQRNGYALVLIGVFLVLLASPSNYNQAIEFHSVHDLLEYILSWEFKCWLALLLLLELILIRRLVIKRIPSIPLFVGICSIFGTISITSVRILSLLLKLSAGDTIHQLSPESALLPKLNTSLIQKAPLVNASMAALNNTEQTITESLNYSPYARHTALVYCIVAVVCAMLAQESFKQQALTIYQVSKFQSLLYAGFNALVILSHVILFREVSGLVAWTWFFMFFWTGIGCILRGFQWVQSDEMNPSSSPAMKDNKVFAKVNRWR